MLQKLIRTWIRRTQFPITIAMTRHKLKRHADRIRGAALDIGAGDQPYRNLLPHLSSYAATNTRSNYSAAEQERLERFTDVWIDGVDPLSFPDCSFDSILCFQVLSVIPEPARLFRECGRVLRPGGCLVLTTDFLYPKWSPEDVMHHTDVHLRRLARQAGLSVEVLESYGGVHTMRHACMNRYILEYPQRLKQLRGAFPRVAFLIRLAFYLAVLPLRGLAGWLVYWRERDRNDESVFTANHLLIARKGANAGSAHEG